MSQGMGLQIKSASERKQEEEQEKQIRKEKETKENREHKIEARENKGFQISKNGYHWAIAGIIVGVVIGSIQIGISVYDIWVKDHEHETRMIQLDSIQVEQNKQIIELLNKIRNSEFFNL